MERYALKSSDIHVRGKASGAVADRIRIEGIAALPIPVVKHHAPARVNDRHRHTDIGKLRNADFINFQIRTGQQQRHRAA